MKLRPAAHNISRKAFLAAVGGFLVTKVPFACGNPSDKAIQAMAKASNLVLPSAKWDASALHGFLEALPQERALELKRSLYLVSRDGGLEELSGAPQDASDIQKELLRLSTHSLLWPFRSSKADHLDYHQLVIWIAEKVGVSQKAIDEYSTLRLERELQKALFSQLWDNLKAEQRVELVQKVDPSGKLVDRTAVSSLGGAAALAALSSTVLFQGFAFYISMSVAISTAAGFAGVTLPFATYTSASSIVGILSGPIGWAVVGMSALGGLLLAGRPNDQAVTALICRIHALKIEALAAAGVREADAFN